MSTIEQTQITGELIDAHSVDRFTVLFTVTDSEIERLRNESFGLTISNTEDYKKCTSLIALARKMRGMTKDCKDELKKDVLTYGRKVDSEHNRIIAKIEEIEAPLKAEKARVDEAKERAKQEAEAARIKEVERRCQCFEEMEYAISPFLVAEMTDQEYRDELERASVSFRDKLAMRVQKNYEAEQARQKEIAEKAAEQEAMRVERKRLDAERAELDKIRAEQEAVAVAELKKRSEAQKVQEEQSRIERLSIEAERKAIQYERERLECEERLRQQAIKEEQEARDQAERERIYAEELAAENAERARLQLFADAEEAERCEAMKPDAEKLKVLGDTLRLLSYPEMATTEGRECLSCVIKSIAQTAEYCEECLS